MLLSTILSNEQKLHVVERARDYIGAPWAHLGRTIRGIDCIGLIFCVANDLGFVPDSADLLNYDRMPEGHKLLMEIGKWGRRINPKDAVPGDVLITRENMNLPNHCGFLAGDKNEPTIIHAYVRKGEVLESPLRFVKPVAAFELQSWTK